MKNMTMKNNVISMSEIINRHSNDRKNAWNKVVAAIHEYTNNFGLIFVTDGISIAINAEYDFSTIGEIKWEG